MVRILTMAVMLKPTYPVERLDLSYGVRDSWATTIVNPLPVIAGLGGNL